MENIPQKPPYVVLFSYTINPPNLIQLIMNRNTCRVAIEESCIIKARCRKLEHHSQEGLECWKMIRKP